MAKNNKIIRPLNSVVKSETKSKDTKEKTQKKSGGDKNKGGTNKQKVAPKEKKQKKQTSKEAPPQEHPEITRERILNELAAIAFASIADVCRWDSEGLEMLDSSRLNPAQLAAVAEISESFGGQGAGQGAGKSTVRLKLHAKLKALEMIGKHLGMFPSGAGRNTQTGTPKLELPEGAEGAEASSEMTIELNHLLKKLYCMPPEPENVEN